MSVRRRLRSRQSETGTCGWKKPLGRRALRRTREMESRPRSLNGSGPLGRQGVLKGAEMEKVQYKGYVIEPRVSRLRDGGFGAEVYIEEHTGPLPALA
jgi:hypothetical protein